MVGTARFELATPRTPSDSHEPHADAPDCSELTKRASLLAFGNLMICHATPCSNRAHAGIWVSLWV